MVRLKEITLNNFKSFKNEHRVKTLMPFTAIVGPNGAGKSNFVDAISFCMGVKATGLRVTSMDQLIYKNPRTKSPEDKMLVKVVLEANDGAVVIFERSVTGSTCQYRVNDNLTSYKTYVEGLAKLHINPRVKDFAVFQDNIESIAMMSPRERTAMFEDISGSGALAAEYKRLSTTISQQLQEFNHQKKTKQMITTKIKTMQVVKKNVDKYRNFEKKLTTAKVTLALFDLHCLERLIETSMIEINRLSGEIDELTKKKLEYEQILASIIQRCIEEKAELTAIEREIHSMIPKIVEVTGDNKRLQAAIEYSQTRVDSCRKSYESALKADEVRKKTIEELEEMLNAIEKSKEEYCLRYSGTLDGTLKLRSSQNDEYEDLKRLFLKTCAGNNQKLISLERNCEYPRDKCDYSRQKADEAKDAIERQIAQRLATKTRGDKLEQCRVRIRSELTDRCKLHRDFHLKLQDLKEQEKMLTKQIEEIGKIDEDGHDFRRIRKNVNIMAILRQNFSGVYDRLGNMCKPIHERYELAVIKVLGPHMNSIVVDTMTTGIACAKYLRAQSVGVETFLPLDSLSVKPLKQHLRSLNDPPNVKLLYDVIKFSPAEISKAVLYAIGNTLVSETAEDASAVAFDMGKKRYNCISRQDGIHFRKSGLISGGTSDTACRVERYNSQEQAKLQLRKEDLMTKLRTIRKDMLSEQESIIDVSATINDLKNRLKYINNDCVKARIELGKDEMKIIALEDIFDNAQAQWLKDQEALEAVLNEINDLKSIIRAEQNQIFAGFCERIGVSEIHQYENGQEEYQRRLQEYNDQIDRIQKQLEFEKRNTTSKVEIWKRKLDIAEAKLRSAIEVKEAHTRDPEYADLLKKFQDLEPIHKNIRREIERTSNEITRLRALLRDISEMLQTCTKHLNGLKSSNVKSKQKRHAILTEARMNGMKIPTINGQAARSSIIETPDTSDSNIDLAALVDESTDTHEDRINLKFDFTKLPIALLKLDESKTAEARKELASKVAEISSAMDDIDVPNMKASQQLLLLKEKKAEMDQTTKGTSAVLHKLTNDFEIVKEERYEKFMKVFERVQERVHSIYKRLARSASAQAYLVPENPEEPYLGRIYFDCMPPGKRFRETTDLSGGEKALASLSLLFAIQSNESPPFQILDEIDASLDNRNVKKVAKYITYTKEAQQTIVVSHKSTLSSAADLLIGIVHKMTDGVESEIFTLNLQPYRKSRT